MNLLDAHGDLVGGTGAPTLAFNHTGALNMAGEPMTILKTGTWPGPNQIVLDTGAAKRAGYHVGDTVSLLPPNGTSQLKMRLAGTAEFNGGSTAGSRPNRHRSRNGTGVNGGTTTSPSAPGNTTTTGTP